MQDGHAGEDRHLDDHRDEEGSARLGCVGRDHGTALTRLRGISAVTESSEAKSTYG